MRNNLKDMNEQKKTGMQESTRGLRRNNDVCGEGTEMKCVWGKKKKGQQAEKMENCYYGRAD
jgi:hypothetical protein